MGCLLSTGHLITSCLQESVNSRWFYAYLMGVAAQVKRSYQVPLVLIVDNASIHRSKQMVDWRKLLVQEYSTTLYFLPAYSPELNRIEMVWKQMKYNWRDFKVMKADQIERWVGQISKGFGNEYMFTFQLILSENSIIDKYDETNNYIVAYLQDELVGMVSITRPNDAKISTLNRVPKDISLYLQCSSHQLSNFYLGNNE